MIRLPNRMLAAAAIAVATIAAASAAAPAAQPSTLPKDAQAKDPCWPAGPPGWSGVQLIGHLRDGAVAQRALGHASAAPLAIDTRLNIASLGKMFTAVAVGQLVDAGHVRFEDPIGIHLPELPEAFRSLTIAQLLTHTAGLGSYLEEQPLQRVEAAASARALVPLATAQPPHDIGRWRYSNSSFALAAAIVESVSGLDYESYVFRHIFAPAGMTRAGFAPAPGDALPTVVVADGTSHHPAIGRVRGGPAGGAFATAEDVYRFARALFDGTLLREATARLMTSLQHEIGPRRVDGIARGWGFGFGVSGTGEMRFFGHTGGVPGASAALRVRVADGRVTVVLSPQDRVDPPDSAALMAVDPAACAQP